MPVDPARPFPIRRWRNPAWYVSRLLRPVDFPIGRVRIALTRGRELETYDDEDLSSHEWSRT